MATKTKAAIANSGSEKSIFRKAGETVGIIGHEIVEGKNILVEKLSEEFTVVKAAIKKGLHKKRQVLKKPIRKTAKKATAKTKPKVSSKSRKKTSSAGKKKLQKKSVPRKKKK